MSNPILFPTKLLPQTPGLLLEHVELTAHCLTLTMQTTHPTATCPRCGIPSARVYSQYMRTVADLAWGGSAVQVVLRVRKFFCQVSACPRCIFTEHLSALVVSYARTTTRLHDVLRLVAFALGGRHESLISQLGKSYHHRQSSIDREEMQHLITTVPTRGCGINFWTGVVTVIITSVV